jgi:hypothetical protein
VNTISAVVLREGRWCRWSADHRHRTNALSFVLAAALVSMSAACDGGRGVGAQPILPAVLDRMVTDKVAPPTDVIEIWICDVPARTDDPRFGDLPLRLALDPVVVTRQIGDRVSAYFDQLSHGAYRPTFTAGGTISMATSNSADHCVETALDSSRPTTTTVLAVATAEHIATEPGGWGRPGSWYDCVADCSARSTRRAAYVGASDFSPDWGSVPLLDLIEHEIGHTLGLPHSGIDPDTGEYLSAIDMMSNSAAPRDTDPSKRDAPDTLAINRVDLGWLPIDDVITVDTRTDLELRPSPGTSGKRLAVIALDVHRMLTIELLTPTGFNEHLDHAGIAVHLIDDRSGARELRDQEPLVGGAPYLDLLQSGDHLEVEGWRIDVTQIVVTLPDPTAHLAVAPADR